MRLKNAAAYLFIISLIFSVGCRARTGEVGSGSNPVRFYFMPLKDKAISEKNEGIIKNYLEEATGLSIKNVEASDFTTIVQAFGEGKADIAFMNTLGYLMARDWAKTEAHLMGLYGDVYKTYRGELLIRADDNITDLSGISGKKVAFSDPFSASGYLYPLKLFKDNNVKPKEMIFANGHKDAIEKLYNGEVDLAAVYHTRPSVDGVQRDARLELIDKYPDIFSKLKILALTDEIPNGPIGMRSDLPSGVKTKLVGALIEFIRTSEGRQALNELYNITGLSLVSDADYDVVQKIVKDLGKSVEEVVPGGVTFYRNNIDSILEH